MLKTLLRRLLATCGLVRSDPVSQREAGHQVAALPVRTTPEGKLKVLLVSTRGRGKLIIPRGWPMEGKADFEAARIEAEEEAGVTGPVSSRPIGRYAYRSARKAAGRPINVDVYRMDVVQSVPAFKEKGERRLLWLDPAEAAGRVGEPGLVPILKALQRLPSGDDQCR